MALKHTCRAALRSPSPILFLAVLLTAPHTLQPQTPDLPTSSSRDANTEDDLANCRVHRVTTLPGSHLFASDFIETIATDPATQDPDTLWGLTADMSNQLPAQDQAIYISKSTNGGATWTQIARIDSRYFDAKIGEGLRKGFIVSPGAANFVVTTQRGAFQIFPQTNPAATLIKPIPGPSVPDTQPKLPIPKKSGDPVRANALAMTPDGRHLIIGYGYFDLTPQILTYHQDDDGSWIEDGALLHPPTAMDILSMQFDDPQNPDPNYLYVGTGDQAYLLNRRNLKWSRIEGVGPDSAIHGMSVVGGLHLAACWALYVPNGPGAVRRVTDARFLFHRSSDEISSNLRAYTIDVDPSTPTREVVTALTGVYTSEDSGTTWRRLNDLPDEEFRSAHFNADGSILVSGIAGTFLVNPFSDTCSPRLKTHVK
ncbi:hypothetical protein [Granulicella sp. L60]|uniref:WD40/YVTN/BNR-like repeat-containing protein n=1 Tax=Granulicella sp. L60 TaxID=1641866 RepID=UPI00131DB8FA|nr:hypothetical protein [Granulicella sp. L60]